MRSHGNSKPNPVAWLTQCSLVLGALLTSLVVQAQWEEEKRPQIDIEDYQIEAELLPAPGQLRARSTVRFTVKDSAIKRVVFDFNANLKLERIYFADKPPKSSALPVTQTEPSSVPTRVTSETQVPYLSRGTKKKAVPVPAIQGTTAPNSDLLRFNQSEEDHTLVVDFNDPLEQSKSVSLVLEYGGVLKATENSPLEGVQLLKIDEEVSYLLAIGRWFPLNGYLRDRATATFRITAPKDFVVVMDGTPKAKELNGDKEISTFMTERPSFPGSLALAKFNVLPVSSAKTEVKFYVKDNKRDYVNPHSEVIGKILELFSEKFGPYPAKELKVVVLDNSSLLGYSAPGMEFLADRAFSSTPNDNLLAREISYQWWQNFITPKSARDLWLREGFAAYSALLYQESVSGEAGFVRELKDTAVAALLHEDKSTIRNAYQLQEYSPEYNSILKAKGAYVLHMLRGVLGDENLFKLIKEYVYTFGYKEASIEDFKALAEKISSQDLTYFFSQWIDQNGVPNFQYDYTTLRVKDGFKVTGTIKQDLDTFRMPIEILIETDGKPETSKVEAMGPESPFSVTAFGKPRRAQLDPNYKVLRMSDEIRVAVLIARGDELRRLGEPTEAIAEYQKAIELNKRSSLAFFRIGEVFFEQKSWNSAANSFREGLNGDLEPKWIEVWSYLNLGRIYDVLSQRERALREYQKALDTNDNTQNAQEVAQKYTQEPYKDEGKRVIIQ